MSDAGFFAILILSATLVAVGAFALGRSTARPVAAAAPGMFGELHVFLAPGLVLRPHEILERLMQADAAIRGLLASRAVSAVIVQPTLGPLEVADSRSTEQLLLDENEELRAEVVRLIELAAWKDRLRARYLRSYRNTRRRLAAFVPADDLEHETSLRSRGIAVARATAARAAAVTECLDVIVLAAHEAAEADLSWDEFNAEVDVILGRVPAHV